MLNQTKFNSEESVAALGEWHPLAAQLGSAEGLVTLGNAAGALKLPRVENRDTLFQFLQAYFRQILVPVELPAILHAYHLAERNEARELIAFDQHLARDPRLRDFARASQRVGQCHLKKLKPLRDVRVIQRYLAAVEAEKAHGWHTLVYGLTLSVYSLPLRQGLLVYAHQTMAGFVRAAARTLKLTEAETRRLCEGLCEHLPEALSRVLSLQAVRGPGVRYPDFSHPG